MSSECESCRRYAYFVYELSYIVLLTKTVIVAYTVDRKCPIHDTKLLIACSEAHVRRSGEWSMPSPYRHIYPDRTSHPFKPYNGHRVGSIDAIESRKAV